MKIYIVVHEDHHSDVAIHAYKSSGDAIVIAKKIIKDFDRFNCAKESKIPGYLYFCTYGPEGDCVSVEEAELHELNLGIDWDRSEFIQ